MKYLETVPDMNNQTAQKAVGMVKYEKYDEIWNPSSELSLLHSQMQIMFFVPQSCLVGYGIEMH